MSFLFTPIDFSLQKTILVVCAVAVLASVDLMRRWKHRPTHLLFATVLGTALSIAMIVSTSNVLQPGTQENPYIMAFAVLMMIVGWRTLFGPWETQTKATMLGTFLFWMSLHIIWNEVPNMRYAHLIAAVVALIPAGVWCMLFLKYHTERISTVLLMFFSGMLATAPILFYDALVRHGVEMQFFLFQIKPESFSQTSSTFASGQLANGSDVRLALMSSVFSFVIVGLIEELSKYWALAHSARKLFSSIDDVLQFAIVVAIGFSFAENIVNPTYFTSFVEQYLLQAGTPDIMGFISNILGRSVLTMMVHIVSTGVLGYFFGLAIFAAPYLAEQKKEGKTYRMLSAVHQIFRLPEVSIFRVEMLTIGLSCAILLHATFNFLVTVPDLLPNHPRTLHELLGNGSPSFLSSIPLLLIPSLLYVVGGFWILTTLFLRKSNMVERGHVITKELFVEEEEEESESQS